MQRDIVRLACEGPARLGENLTEVFFIQPWQESSGANFPKHHLVCSWRNPKEWVCLRPCVQAEGGFAPWVLSYSGCAHPTLAHPREDSWDGPFPKVGPPAAGNAEPSPRSGSPALPFPLRGLLHFSLSLSLGGRGLCPELSLFKEPHSQVRFSLSVCFGRWGELISTAPQV